MGEELNINQTKEDKQGYFRTKNEDFEVTFELVGDYLYLNWINIKSGRVKGKDILKTIIGIAQKHNCKGVWAKWESGLISGVQATGYYVGMKWGFLPDKGIEFINKTLGSDYKSYEEMYDDKDFLSKWKSKSQPYSGTFDLTSNSISFKQFNKA